MNLSLEHDFDTKESNEILLCMLVVIKSYIHRDAAPIFHSVMRMHTSVSVDTSYFKTLNLLLFCRRE